MMARAVFLVLALPLARATLYCAKRTFPSPDGAADEAFYNTYFGPRDSVSLRDAGGLGDGVCLTRYLEYALPSHFGVHFPTSTVTPEGETPLANWTAARAAALAVAFADGASSYSAFVDHATAFWVPELSAHVAAFEAGAIGVMRRSYADAAGARVYVATVATPSSAQAFELHAPACADCDDAEWPSYAASGECATAHALPHATAHYARWWNESAAEAGWLDGLESAVSGGASGGASASLPVAMVAQLRVASSRLAAAKAYWRAVWPEVELEEVAESGGDQCSFFRASVRSASYDVATDGPHPYTDYELDVVVVQNDAADLADRDAFRAYESYVEATHAQFLGVNGGMDRYVDEHFRIESDATPLDEFARRLERLGAGNASAALAKRYHAFDWSRTCPGADLTLAGYMIYSAGFGAQSVEIGADTADYTHFSNESLFAIDPCSPTYSCLAWTEKADGVAVALATDEDARPAAIAPPASRTSALLVAGAVVVAAGWVLRARRPRASPGRDEARSLLG